MNDMVTIELDAPYERISIQAEKLRADIRGLDFIKNRQPRSELAMVASDGRMAEAREYIEKATEIYVATLVRYDELLNEMEQE